jgi:hypothetical protein
LLCAVNVQADSIAFIYAAPAATTLRASPDPSVIAVASSTTENRASPNIATTRTIYTGLIASPLSVRELRTPEPRRPLLGPIRDWTQMKTADKAQPLDHIVLAQSASLAEIFVAPMARYTASASQAGNAPMPEGPRDSTSANAAHADAPDVRANVSLGFAAAAAPPGAVDMRFSQSQGR